MILQSLFTDPTTSADASIVAILLGLGILLIFLIPIFIALYLLTAFGQFTMSKRSNNPELVKYAWFAFVPFLQAYNLGALVEDVVHRPLSGYMKWVLLGGSVANLLLGTLLPFLPYIFVAFSLYALFFLFKKYSPSAIMLFIVSFITFGIGAAIAIFVLRKRDPRPEAIVNDTTVQA
ncbi:hypothetical protein [Aureibacillus halotolerans]|uniref:Uncharacterized protein n=1 Tax=Aureibacillus halotolerans TaxID=1508390 RepID=A0A4R6TPP7_9BACI|nr:hypothetical protein [Aureibacillus halotolerans]TDQ34159.1 hypothetical protein EV213_12624 [Aureibacillus halotolerans]